MLAAPAAGSEGQVENETGTVHIPVIADPYGGYYRVICPIIDAGDTDAVKKKKLRKGSAVEMDESIIETRQCEECFLIQEQFVGLGIQSKSLKECRLP